MLGLLFFSVLSLSRAQCPLADGSSIVVADIHDGDKKQVALAASTVTITPYDNNETWTIVAKVQPDCTATVDFNVPGKPAPPPVNLTATISSLDDVKVAIGFTDPTATIAASADYPVNYWVEIDPPTRRSVVG